VQVQTKWQYYISDINFNFMLKLISHSNIHIQICTDCSLFPRHAVTKTAGPGRIIQVSKTSYCIQQIFDKKKKNIKYYSQEATESHLMIFRPVLSWIRLYNCTFVRNFTCSFQEQGAIKKSENQ
jgi:hypothetical protein